jgi:hypothetical protein
MIGNCEKPEFETHLKEGPYLVSDDAARPEYKNDPRVHFVGGHPVLRDVMTGLLKGLGANANVSGQAIMAYEQLQRWGQHNLEYGTPTRRALTIAKPLVAGLAVAGVAALGKVIGKFAKKFDEK